MVAVVVVVVVVVAVVVLEDLGVVGGAVVKVRTFAAHVQQATCNMQLVFDMLALVRKAQQQQQQQQQQQIIYKQQTNEYINKQINE